MSGSIVVDYEELHRMSRVWAAAAEALARLSIRVAAATVSAAIVEGAVFDPFGAARAEAAIADVALGPGGLAELAAVLAGDAIHLESVVVREQVVDDLPVAQLAALGRWLVAASWRLPLDPIATLSDGGRRLGSVADAAVGYLAPFTEPLLGNLAPSAVFRADALGRRRVEVDPVLGLPIGLVGKVAPEGAGGVRVSGYVPAWAVAAPASLAEAMARVADLEMQPAAELAVQAVVSADGVRRYVVELPGIRSVASRQQPQDLLGAIDAMAGDDSTYANCVREALDSAGVPVGAEVMLVGHSDGGIVAMELAADRSFNGSRVVVTNVVAAGSPISSMMRSTAIPASTRVVSVENVNDIVTHLDAVDSMDRPPTATRLTYQYSHDDHDVGVNHAALGYAERMEVLAESPNPLMREFQGSVQHYLWTSAASTTTTVFTLMDAPEPP